MNFFGLNENLSLDDYKNLENEITYKQIIEYLKMNKQVLVFVHSRMETISFAQEILKLLVSTSTLAWGVNLPAYACIIKGTKYYDASNSKFIGLFY